MSWTYYLQDARTGEWLHRDLPLFDVEIIDVLTGHCTLTGTLVPEDNAIDDLIEEWGNFLYAEKGDGIRFGGILTTTSLADEGQALQITAESFTRYADGQTYGSGTDKFRLWSADPLDCLRYIWSWLQDRSASSDIGLVLDNDTSGVEISDNQPPPRPRRSTVTYPAGSVYGDAGDHWPRPPRPKRPKTRRPKKRDRREGESDDHWEDYLEWFNEKLDTWQDGYQTLNKGRLKPWRAWKRRFKFLRKKWQDDYGDREPYKLSWWEEVDLGQEASRLAEEGDFEWRERHIWTDGTKTAVKHRLQLGHPTIGADKTDPVLTINSDLAAQPRADHGGARYANRVIALGAGEGRKTRKAEVGGDDGRLRREVTILRKRMKRLQRLAAAAREQRSFRTLLRDIPEIEVWDDDGNLGEYRLGDTIAVRLVGTFWKSGTTQHRVVGRRLRPDSDDRFTLQLVRAERNST